MIHGINQVSDMILQELIVTKHVCVCRRNMNFNFNSYIFLCVIRKYVYVNREWLG